MPVLCPLCYQPLNLSAVVPTFLAEPDWLFWGQVGCRWIVCQGENVTHFKVQENGTVSHRLARIDPEAYNRYNEAVVISEERPEKKVKKRDR